jgi:septum formation protein
VPDPAPVLVLASASPRRAHILRSLGVVFRTRPADVDESLFPGEEPWDAAERLARAKAGAVAASETLPVLGADTLVVREGTVLGKPSSPEDAGRMLRVLSGTTHEVVTGVCLVVNGRARSGRDRTAVTFAPLSDREIAWYVATGEPLDKAGAYHVDGRGALFIERLQGSSSNVAGLPVALLYRLARESGLDLVPLQAG